LSKLINTFLIFHNDGINLISLHGEKIFECFEKYQI
jgi:hypothetical protein